MGDTNKQYKDVAFVLHKKAFFTSCVIESNGYSLLCGKEKSH